VSTCCYSYVYIENEYDCSINYKEKLQKLVLGYYRQGGLGDKVIYVCDKPDLRGRVKASVSVQLDYVSDKERSMNGVRYWRFEGTKDISKTTSEQQAARLAFSKCANYFHQRQATAKAALAQQLRLSLPQGSQGLRPVDSVSINQPHAEFSSAERPAQPPPSSATATINYKSLLQDWAQKKYRGTRRIEDIVAYSTTPMPTEKMFQTTVDIHIFSLAADGNYDYEPLTFKGREQRGKRASEQDAARAALMSGNAEFSHLLRNSAFSDNVDPVEPHAEADAAGDSRKCTLSERSNPSPAAAGSINYKNILQEWAQQTYRGTRPIESIIMYSALPPLTQAQLPFQSQVEIYVDSDFVTYIGEMATTKKASEQAAARMALVSHAVFGDICRRLGISRLHEPFPVTPQVLKMPAPTVQAQASAPAPASIRAQTSVPTPIQAQTSEPTPIQAQTSVQAPVQVRAQTAAPISVQVRAQTSAAAPIQAQTAVPVCAANYKNMLQEWAQKKYRASLPLDVVIRYSLLPSPSHDFFQSCVSVVINHEETVESKPLTLRFIGEPKSSKKLSEQDAARVAVAQRPDIFLENDEMRPVPTGNQPNHDEQPTAHACETPSKPPATGTFQVEERAPTLDAATNYKNKLQSWVQNKFRGALPIEKCLQYATTAAEAGYFTSTVSVLTDSHQQEYLVVSTATKFPAKKEAEQAAAHKALQHPLIMALGGTGIADAKSTSEGRSNSTKTVTADPDKDSSEMDVGAGVPGTGSGGINYKNLLQERMQKKYGGSQLSVDALVRYTHITPPPPTTQPGGRNDKENNTTANGYSTPDPTPVFQCNVTILVGLPTHTQTFYGEKLHTTKKAAEQEAAQHALRSAFFRTGTV
jgi:dsRNA-specific ribonuclease